MRRAAMVNQIRSLLLERVLTLPKGRSQYVDAVLPRILEDAHASKHKGVFFGGDSHQTKQCLCLFCNPYRVVRTDLSLVFPCGICCENVAGIGRRSDSECDGHSAGAFGMPK
jgi:hypothetical protein